MFYWVVGAQLKLVKSFLNADVPVVIKFGMYCLLISKHVSFENTENVYACVMIK